MQGDLFQITMASDALKAMQDKLFRGGPSQEPTDNDNQGQPPGLTINIPGKQEASSSVPFPTAPPKMNKSDSSPKAINDRPEDYQPYRERLARQLGQDYKGTERHRLEQDADKDRHWKRWGPYLSNRQWVCYGAFIYASMYSLSVGNGARRLLR